MNIPETCRPACPKVFRLLDKKAQQVEEGHLISLYDTNLTVQFIAKSNIDVGNVSNMIN